MRPPIITDSKNEKGPCGFISHLVYGTNHRDTGTQGHRENKTETYLESKYKRKSIKKTVAKVLRTYRTANIIRIRGMYVY